MGQGFTYRQTGCRIPQAHGTVRTARGDPASVGTEPRALDAATIEGRREVALVMAHDIGERERVSGIQIP